MSLRSSDIGSFAKIFSSLILLLNSDSSFAIISLYLLITGSSTRFNNFLCSSSGLSKEPMRNGLGKRLLNTVSNPEALSSCEYSCFSGFQVVLLGFPPSKGHSHFERTNNNPSSVFSFHFSSILPALLGI